MIRTADGKMVTEFRAPRPGEKDYVVCHCQAKRAAAQTGWFVPTSAPLVASPAPRFDVPVVFFAWTKTEPLVGSKDPPTDPISHPPAA